MSRVNPRVHAETLPALAAVAAPTNKILAIGSVTAKGTALLVSIKNSKGTRAIVPGDAIDPAIDPEDIHVLQR